MKNINAIVLTCGLLLAASFLNAEPPMDPYDQPPLGTPGSLFHFDKEVTGKLPKGFAVSGPKEVPGQWSVQAVRHAASGSNALVANEKAAPDTPFSLCVLSDLPIENGDITVKFKLVSKSDSQSLGIVYHYQSPQQYRVVTVDGKDLSCHLYAYKKGKRKQLDTQALLVTPEIWHTLRLIFRKTHYSLYMDGSLAMGGKAKSNIGRGLIGLWTEGDTTVQFDDLAIAP